METIHVGAPLLQVDVDVNFVAQWRPSGGGLVGADDVARSNVLDVKEPEHLGRAHPCPYVQVLCADVVPELRQVGSSLVACHFADTLSLVGRRER